jgi:hypothetical protein
VALSAEFVDHHIENWQQELTGTYYPHRKHWPAYLFHHAPMENAVAILKDGHLRSRNDASNCRPRDVAAPGVIDARVEAHDRVRLYFRPKTPTQWHIEGIRKPGECLYGDATHAGVLVMFALDARLVLMKPEIMFSNQNMQLGNTQAGFDEDYFSEIPFRKVYSEGGTGGDRSYTDARCAEVLPKSPLSLNECLREIYLRSEPERDTLLHLLGDAREHWEQFLHISDTLQVFQKDYTFVQELRLSSDGVIFRFNPRRDGMNLKVQIKLWDLSGNLLTDFLNDNFPAAPNPPSKNWIWKQKLKNGKYRAEVRLDDTIAYQAELSLGDSLF